MPLIPALGKQRQADLSEFKASLVYKVSFRTARTANTEKLCLKIQNNKTNKKKKMEPHRWQFHQDYDNTIKLNNST
ncbi:hypothetical protein I79_026099 [Cricetulus griseus]|uniref:Uncharacterized protein n=1 Tax=Cricetulus griseus TaxID=10029 RepID=G3IQ14_CRIGR|nr:hypothetical protein I79_026099 [Cricetulus griseus]